MGDPTAEVRLRPGAERILEAVAAANGGKQIAIRSWMRIDQGIAVRCLCELGYACPLNGRTLELDPIAGVEAQIREQIEALRRDYGVPTRRVLYYAFVRGAPQQVPRLTLPAEWKARQE